MNEQQDSNIRHGLPASALAESAVTSIPCVGTGGVAWTEMDPRNQGRTCIWVLSNNGKKLQVLDSTWNVRSQVHEYGGGALWAGTGDYHWFFVDDPTQSIWGLRADNLKPERLLEGNPRTPIGDGHVSGDGSRMVFLREDLARNRTNVVLIQTANPSNQRILDSRHAFCAAPRLSPDGRNVAWLVWDEGVMPWESSRLQWIDLNTGERMIAGSTDTSLLEPHWSANGTLYCLTDQDGAWAPARVSRSGIKPIIRSRFDMCRPPWQLGNSHYGLLPDGGFAAVRIRHGNCELVRQYPDNTLQIIDGPENDFEGLRIEGWAAIVLAGTPDSGRRIIRIDMRTGKRAPLTSDPKPALPSKWVSRAEAVSTIGPHGRIYGFYYAPMNNIRDKTGHENQHPQLPPLLVRAHGGPTAMRSPVFSLDTQFWTSHGFAVLDVNYGGSSGHGRAYRERLRGQWGRVDRDDCITLAVEMAAQGRVDGKRMVITGNSAGGLTVLNCLTRGVFAAGTSRYGVTDLELLAHSTHRFEAGYLGFLLGVLPEHVRTYRRRSPVHHAKDIKGSVLLLQGEDDPVVPASQAHAIKDAISAIGGDARLVIYKGEKHGFRRGENLQDSYEQELAFYQEVLGIRP